MADIGALGQLAPSEPIDIDLYAASRKKPAFPAKGRYTFRAPEQFVFGKTAAGNLSAQIDPTIVGGESDGYTIRFQRVSAKVYQQKGVSTSQLGQYLAACGVKGNLSGDPQVLADAVEGTANQTFDAYVDWELYAKGHGVNGEPIEIKGMENFPVREDGTPQPFINSPTQKDADGKPVRIWANARIQNYIVAV